MERASVKRLDVGMNLITRHKPERYYPLLGQSRHYKRLLQPRSIRYENSLRSIKIYDKIAESHSKGGLVPERLKDSHVLRFELCFMQRLARQLGASPLTPPAILDESLYIGLAHRMAEEYRAIHKVGSVAFDVNEIGSPKDYLRQITAQAIQEKGVSSYLEHVNLLREQGAFKQKAYYSRLRRELRELATISIGTNAPDLISELNSKVELAQEVYLSRL